MQKQTNKQTNKEANKTKQQKERLSFHKEIISTYPLFGGCVYWRRATKKSNFEFFEVPSLINLGVGPMP